MLDEHTCATEVVYRNDQIHYVNPPFDLRRPRLRPRDRLVVRRPFLTLGGRFFDRGSILLLVGRTFERPYGFLCTAGNWIVQTKDQEGVLKLGDKPVEPVSIWSSIERSYAERNLDLFHEEVLSNQV